MTINELLNEQSVFIPLASASKEETIKLLVDGLAQSGSLSDKNAYLEAVKTR